MSTQHVNLYLPEYRPKREFVTALNSAVSVVLFLIAIVLFQLARVEELNVLELKVEGLTQESISLQESVAILKKTPVGGDRKRLGKKIERVRAAIGNRNQIKQLMSGQSLGNEIGFSRYLDAFGTFADSNLYLNHFHLRKGGRFATVSGISKKSESVPLYISRLQSGSIFSETKFGSLNIEKQGAHVRFWSEGEEGVLDEAVRYEMSKR